MTDEEDKRIVLEVVLHLSSWGGPLIIDESLRRRDDRETGLGEITTKVGGRCVISVDVCVLVSGDSNGVSEIPRRARLEDVVANRSTVSAGSGTVVGSPNHSADGDAHLHHVRFSDEGVAFDDGTFERPRPRIPVDHVDTSERTTIPRDDCVSGDGRSKSSENYDSSVGAIHNGVSGYDRSSASHGDTVRPFSRTNVGRVVNSLSFLELDSVVRRVARGTNLIILDDHSTTRVCVTLDTVENRPTSRFVQVAVLDRLAFGVTSELKKGDSLRKPTEFVASSVHLNVLDDNVLASIAGGKDSTRLIRPRHFEKRSRIVGRISLSCEDLVRSREEDGIGEGEVSSGTKLYDRTRTSIVESRIDVDVGRS